MPTTGVTESTSPLSSLKDSSRPGLLVSVRDAMEARVALRGGADVIDVKEPDNGPLGAASCGVIEAVVQEVAGAVPVTAALGELADGPRLDGLPSGLAAVKVGLAGVVSRLRWRDDLVAVRDRLPAGLPLVAASYADTARAGAPEPEGVLEASVELGSGWIVLDTWDKSGGNSLEYLGKPRARRLIEQAAKAGISLVLAGGLVETRIDDAASLAPALVGVRGAACEGGRTGAVSAARVQSISQRLANSRNPR